MEKITDSSTSAQQGTQMSNQEGLQPSVDDIFGNPADDLGKSGSEQLGEPTQTSSKGKRQHKSADEFINQLKSKLDKTTHELEQFKAQTEELKGVADFVNKVYDDEELFNAFVAEIKPDLLKPPSPEAYIRKRLSDEFGEDFVPDEAEANVQGSRSWLYAKRADDFYREAMDQSNKVPETISQMRERQKKAQKEAQVKAEQEKYALMTSKGWSEEQWGAFTEWANKLTLGYLADAYSRGINKQTSSYKTPSLANIPGGTPIDDASHMKHLTEMFG